MNIVRDSIDKRGLTDKRLHLPFALLWLYYWVYQYFIGTNDAIEVDTMDYYYTVIPSILFVSIYILLLQYRAINIRSKSIQCLSAYLVIVISTSLIRADWRTLYSQILFSGMLLVVICHNMTLPVKLINYVYLLSIPLAVMSYTWGYSIYNVIPYSSANDDLPWRISIAPSAAQGAYFSLIVLFVNIFNKKEPFRNICIIVSLYFLTLSGTRSALIAGVICGVWVILIRRGMLKSLVSNIGFILVAISGFVLFVALPYFVLLIPNIGDGEINTYFYRSATGFQDETEAAQSIYRGWIWSEHIRMASENPIFGLGTFDFKQLMVDVKGFNLSNGSESFLTALYVRVGIASVLIVAFIIYTSMDGIKMGLPIPFIMGLTILVAMLGYGSFITVYNPIFLAMIGFLNSSNTGTPLFTDNANPITLTLLEIYGTKRQGHNCVSTTGI